MFLNMENLTRRFNEFTAVDNLNLQVSRGELVCLLGPSGCGKTTTISMIGGFIPPSCGRILLDGEDITCQPAHLRPTSTVFQSYALFPHMNVIQNVIYGLKFKGVSKKESLIRGENFLEMVGISRLKHHKIHQLSGGEQQRVALARSLILEPKVLLLDEPLSNLDVQLRVSLRKEIKQVQTRTGITMVYVTHDQEEALSIADRICVMAEGRMEQVGEPEQVYLYPETEFVSRFIGRANRLFGNDGLPVFIRPESMRLSPDRGTYRGKVLQRQFTGAIVTYIIKLENPGTVQDATIDTHLYHPVEVDLLSSQDPGLSNGDTVFVSSARVRSPA